MTSLVKRVVGAVGGVGLAVALGAGYLIVRGPFLDGATLAPRPLLAALGAFIVGVAIAAWGLTRYARF
ncbi:hypothetical protein SAMN04488065_0060 [Haloplanus vescus]|uniref:DUF8132 domain-containing protein n=1 Tax=Haloplanus vescus TaxID=555874 RepID=A0A1H3VL93_9EURY|nr:hypothetical protein [Haloplanus vescus]SDZ75545.1 hypothetical protein SAMN04488065_0060 [Haloplanus vescus]